MQYNFVEIKLADDKNGQQYVSTKCVKAGDPNDRGFNLPFFNPQIIGGVKTAINKGETPSFQLEAEIEEEAVSLGAVYFRRATSPDGKITDQPALDPSTNKPIPYRKLNVHTIFQYAMHDAFYVEGERKGMRIMEDVYENGQKISRPAKAFDLDDYGKPKRNYMRGWTPEERRDQILKTFFMLAPQEYQDAAAATEAPQGSTAAPEPSLNDVAAGMFGAAPQQPAPGANAGQVVNPLS